MNKTTMTGSGPDFHLTWLTASPLQASPVATVVVAGALALLCLQAYISWNRPLVSAAWPVLACWKECGVDNSTQAQLSFGLSGVLKPVLSRFRAWAYLVNGMAIIQDGFEKASWHDKDRVSAYTFKLSSCSPVASPMKSLLLMVVTSSLLLRSTSRSSTRRPTRSYRFRPRPSRCSNRCTPCMPSTGSTAEGRRAWAL